MFTIEKKKEGEKRYRICSFVDLFPFVYCVLFLHADIFALKMQTAIFSETSMHMA